MSPAPRPQPGAHVAPHPRQCVAAYTCKGSMANSFLSPAYLVLSGSCLRLWLQGPEPPEVQAMNCALHDEYRRLQEAYEGVTGSQWQ